MADRQKTVREVPPGRKRVGFAAALLIAGLLTIAAIGPWTASALAQSPDFPDVSASMPAYDAIGFLSGADIISGYEDGDFGPSDTLKRGQATKMLVLWQGVTPIETASSSASSSSFPDLDDTYRPYVETACDEGWITGYPDGRFKPYSTLSRQQMATIMVRAMGREDVALGLSEDQIAETLSAFGDEAAISGVARAYVATAVSEGLFGGDSEGNFKPRDGITRAQFCLVVFRAELTERSVIKEVRSASDWPDRTRIVVDLSKAPGNVTACASQDGVLTIDYTDGAVAGKIEQAIDGSVEVSSVSALQLSYEPRTVRILVDLGRYRSVRVMSLAPSEEKGYRIAVDVFRRTDGPDGDGPPLVCVDPGHGGKDAGAIGVSGTEEKNVNLAIGLFLADDLRQAGLRVIMTRDDDSFPVLEDRPLIAETAGANLFVAVHSNACGDGDEGANGTETYSWGLAPDYSVEGKMLAESIQRNLVEAIGSLDRGTKTANYLVLRETEMTAALVEVGFLTNAAEEAKLITGAYQQAAARGIAEGILEYLKWSTTVYSAES